MNISKTGHLEKSSDFGSHLFGQNNRFALLWLAADVKTLRRQLPDHPPQLITVSDCGDSAGTAFAKKKLKKVGIDKFLTVKERFICHSNLD